MRTGSSESAATAYPHATSVTRRDDAVLVHLDDDDAASLNRFLAGQGLFVGYIAPQRFSLEEAFIDLTRDDLAPIAAGVA